MAFPCAPTNYLQYKIAGCVHTPMAKYSQRIDDQSNPVNTDLFSHEYSIFGAVRLTLLSLLTWVLITFNIRRRGASGLAMHTITAASCETYPYMVSSFTRWVCTIELWVLDISVVFEKNSHCSNTVMAFANANLGNCQTGLRDSCVGFLKLYC